MIRGDRVLVVARAEERRTEERTTWNGYNSRREYDGGTIKKFYL